MAVANQNAGILAVQWVLINSGKAEVAKGWWVPVPTDSKRVVIHILVSHQV